MFKKIINKIKDYKRGKEALNPIGGRIQFEGNLFAKVIQVDGTVKDLGLISKRLVTTAFCEFMVDQLITESAAFGNFKYHHSGTGTTAANITDTHMETTSSADICSTGTQVESGSVGYKSVGTQSYTESESITEHGFFNAADGVLMDRHTFSSIGVENGMDIEWTYFLTVTAGG